MKKIKFGLIVPQGWKLDLPDDISPVEQFEIIVRTARDAEKLGYESIWLFDHFHTVPIVKNRSVFECWTTLSALAAKTDRVKLGQIVTCNSYRNPSLLAKHASILDVISGGRLVLGMGAGWYEHEYLGYGYDFPRAAERIGMLDEAVEIIKRMWTEPVVNFEGKYYKLQGAINYPKPVQKPRPPIVIGGGGEKLTLRVVAKHADIYNLNIGTPEYFERKVRILREHCASIKRDPNEIELSFHTDVIIGETEAEVRGLVQELIDEGLNKKYRCKGIWDPMSKDEYLWGRIVGTPEQCAGQIKEFIKLGATHFVLFFRKAVERETHKLFAKEVIPLINP
jgi:F420-dependent oxidoreductase-like protein